MKILRTCAIFLIPLILLLTFGFLMMNSSSYKVFVIHTGSMSPTIPPGSAVLVHEGHYHLGQVVTFTEQGLTVTHRLVSISPEGLTTTKGDANSSADPWHVPKSQIIGGVIFAPRYVGYWIMYFKDPLGLGSAILVILVIWQVWSLTSVKESGSSEGSPSSTRDSEAVSGDENGESEDTVTVGDVKSSGK